MIFRDIFLDWNIHLWQVVQRSFKNVCFFIFNLGWRDHIKHKAHAEILHNTEKHEKKNNRSKSQI